MVKNPLVRSGCASALRCGAARPVVPGARVLGRDGGETCDGGWDGVVDTNDVGFSGVVGALGDRPGTWIGVARAPGIDTDPPSNGFPAPGGGAGETPVS